MTERAHELSATADLQIAELTELLSRLDRHRTPRFLRALSHGSHETSTTSPRPRDHGADQHDDGYTADNIDLDAVVEQLRASRNTLGRIAELTDSQLNQVPPGGELSLLRWATH